MTDKTETRQLTVSRTGDYRKPVPLLRLQGQWLERAGFPAGSRVVVKVQKGRLVIQSMGTGDRRQPTRRSPASMP